MSALVTELKEEHAAIVEALNEIKRLRISSKEGQAALGAAKDGLLAHLGKEDEQLYPALQKAAETNAELEAILGLFSSDMKAISGQALEFFDRYADGGVGFEFARDFGALLAALGNRIRKEENLLYAKYDEFVG